MPTTCPARSHLKKASNDGPQVRQERAGVAGLEGVVAHVEDEAKLLLDVAD